MFERYSESARRAIFYARWWALDRKSTQIETGDIILGAAQVARAANSPLRWMNLDHEKIVSLFASDVTPIAEPEAKDIPLSDFSKRALAYAAMEVNSDKRYCLEVYHLVRGVLCTGDQTAQTLIECGFSLDALRASSRDANKRLGDAKLRLRFKTSLQLLRFRLSRMRLSVMCITLLLFVLAILYLRSQN